ncbi:MAG: NRDE family protein [Luteimonas sp.]
MPTSTPSHVPGKDYAWSMCLIAIAWRAHPRYPLALIANRDEFHARPTTPAGFDPEAGHAYGGRDLVQGGSWLQVSAPGRLAAVTNVRDGLGAESAPRSRGWLVHDFIRGSEPALTSAGALAEHAPDYGRYNLLLWDGDALAFASNHPQPAHAAVAPGLHAMSNGAFDAPWPKSGHATRALEAWLRSAATDGPVVDAIDSLSPLFTALADTTPATDDTLPETGVGLTLERALSPPFVRGERYGTRCSSVVLVSEDALVFAERRFGPDAAPAGESFIRLLRGNA